MVWHKNLKRWIFRHLQDSNLRSRMNALNIVAVQENGQPIAGARLYHSAKVTWM